MVASSPIVTGISPKEANAGTKLTIRGENLGKSPRDLLDVRILGKDCLLTVDWKSPNKLLALCPGGAEGSGEILVTTLSGGLGTCTVVFQCLKDGFGPLKEIAYWSNEFNFIRKRRKNRMFSPLEVQDETLGLSVEGNESSNKFPENKLQEMFPEFSGDINYENFDPVYFLLKNHYGTTFEDLKAGLAFLRRKVDGENESQISFIKGNVSSIMDQLDALKSIKKRYTIDTSESIAQDPTFDVHEAILRAKEEADRMFFDVLGRKDLADSTRNAINVLNRFKFLFLLPVNIKSNVFKGDYDRVIDEYDRSVNLYGNSESPIFKKYLEEIEKNVQSLREFLEDKLKGSLTLEQQKKILSNLVQLNPDEDPSWTLIMTQHSRLLEYFEKLSSKNTEESEETPSYVLLVEEISDRLSGDFPNLWKLGQSYFKGDLFVSPDSNKRSIFKDMILGAMNTGSKLIHSAIYPAVQETDKIHGAAIWLPHILRYVRNTFLSLLECDLPREICDILSSLTTHLRIQSLQAIFQNIINQVHLLHEKEDWSRDNNTDDFGLITELPEMFGAIVFESLVLIKDAIVCDNTNNTIEEEDILSYKNATNDLEHLIANVLSSFAYALENAAIGDYGSTNTPRDSLRLLLCINNCTYTQKYILPKIIKAFTEILSKRWSLETPIKCYVILDSKLFEAYMELKIEPIVALIEPSMYVGKFDWARCPKAFDARDYVKEIFHNVISVHSEVERVISESNNKLLSAVMIRLVESVAEEVNRLFCSISRMNSNGCIQAWVDIHCLKYALGPYLNAASIKYLDDASKPLLDLEKPGDSLIVESCQMEFKKRMHFYLVTFLISSK